MIDIGRVRALLGLLRARTGGEAAILLSCDGRPFALDASSDVEPLLHEVAQRRARCGVPDRFDAFASKSGRTVMLMPIDDRGLVVVDLGPHTSIGLARVGSKPLLTDLEAAIRPPTLH